MFKNRKILLLSAPGQGHLPERGEVRDGGGDYRGGGGEGAEQEQGAAEEQLGEPG